MIAAGLCWFCVQALCADATPSAVQVDELQDWRSWRAHWLVRVQDDTGSALSQLRQRHERARERADRHAEWMYLAWLARETARWEHAESTPWLTLAEQALQSAQRAGDALASFELLLAGESARLQQQVDVVREARLAQADALATELGDPLRTGLVIRLRGLAALHEGQPGEALVHYQRAMPLLTQPADRAELLGLMVQAVLELPGQDAAGQADRYLRDLTALPGAERQAVAIDTLLLQTEVLVRRSRHAEAISHAQRAVALARQLAVASPLARAQSVLGRAFLAAGDTPQALAHLQAVSIDALNLPDQLATLGAHASALAQHGDRRAADVIAEGRAIIDRAPQPQNSAVLRFHELTSHGFARLGDTAQARLALARAAALRATMADSTRDRLVQARLDAARAAAAARADARQDRVMAATALALLLTAASAAGLTLWHRRQRQHLDRRRLELADINAHLRAVNTARRRHLAAACHDLRQPALVIEQIAGTALASPDPRWPAAPGQLQAAERCSRTLSDMLDALLDLSVLEQGRYEPRMQAVALGDLLADVALQYRRAAQDKGLTWQVGGSTATVYADRQLLRRVLFHLASNAVRHSGQGGIQILAVTTPTQVWVDVADTGPGLPVEQLLGNPTDAGAALGQGAGLAIVREACRLMSHEVSVPLSSPRGSVVRVRMPRCEPPPAASAPPAASLAGITVAVVQPDQARQQDLLHAVTAAGGRAAVFESLAALRSAGPAFTPSGPDALVVDLGAQALMPATQSLQAWLQHCPDWHGVVLALSADLSLDALLHAAELGMHLACQPLSAHRLVALLQDLLRPIDPDADGRAPSRMAQSQEVPLP